LRSTARRPGVRLARRAARAVESARRLQEAAAAALGPLLTYALDADERVALGRLLYGDALGPAPRADASPFAWERAWWTQALPPPPARLLIGGAGAGREVRALVADGYEVFACDPLPAAVAALGSLLGPAAVACADHESPERWPGPPRVDAVIFGWGSLTHVLDAPGRLRALAAADARTDGPILASVWTREAFPVPTGRATRAGAAVGRFIGRARGLAVASGPNEDVPDDLGFAPWCGFGARVTPAELEAAGRALGREVRFVPAPYPHVTLTRPPRTPPG
jgi:SAM-dependent methyltransferase